MELKFDNYSIAPIHHKDAWRLCDFVVSNAERLKDFFPKTLKANLTPTLAELFVNQKVKEFQNNDEYLFTVKENTNRTIIGLVFLKELDKAPQQGEFAYCISYRYQGKGLSTTCIAKLTDWAFQKVRLNTLQIIVHKKNLASIRVAEKNGFVFKKTLEKEHQLYKGDWVNMELYERYAS
ncbi:GNAT family protein [uncultured Croceitalea sp.]|uniref:GNAT family N-acetyltransferase n=1 Tax=uncultured Croceitalea sp. TaxID=1798908 RepID=UPI0033060136